LEKVKVILGLVPYAIVISTGSKKTFKDELSDLAQEMGSAVDFDMFCSMVLQLFTVHGEENIELKEKKSTIEKLDDFLF